MAAELCAMTVAERAEVPGLDPARAPTIAGATVIVAAVMEVARLDRMTVSERDLLDGVAIAHMPRP
jgi:exopolyphosphatase/guanosine-5'-triphosphate,3'-diphosphate pyrophosphatase